MPILTPGKTLATSKPTLTVENELAPGQYRFQLVVVDDTALESAPTDLTITIQPRGGTRPVDPRIPIDVIVRPDLTRTPVDPRIDPRILTPVRPVSPPPPEPFRPVIRPVRPIR